jgi:hypothetical protein
LFRAEEERRYETSDQLATLADALTAPAPTDRDPVDALFFG